MSDHLAGAFNKTIHPCFFSLSIGALTLGIHNPPNTWWVGVWNRRCWGVQTHTHKVFGCPRVRIIGSQNFGEPTKNLAKKQNHSSRRRVQSLILRVAFLSVFISGSTPKVNPANPPSTPIVQIAVFRIQVTEEVTVEVWVSHHDIPMRIFSRHLKDGEFAPEKWWFDSVWF